MQNIIFFYLNYTVKFLINKDYLKSISNILGINKLILNYSLKKEGMYKVDICHGAVLYEYGRSYFNANMQACMNIFSTLKKIQSLLLFKYVARVNRKGYFFKYLLVL